MPRCPDCNKPMEWVENAPAPKYSDTETGYHRYVCETSTNSEAPGCNCLNGDLRTSTCHDQILDHDTCPECGKEVVQ